MSHTLTLGYLSLLCVFALCVHQAFSLSDSKQVLTQKSHKLTHVGENAHLLTKRAATEHARQKRQLQNQPDPALYVNVHNALRRQEGSSNMNVLVSDWVRVVQHERASE